MLSLIISIILIAVDRISKICISHFMKLYDEIPVIPGFEFYYTHNTGAAFSILSSKTWFLSIISVLFCVVVIVFYIKKQPTNKLLLASLILIFSGAFGNAIDRIFYKYVVDFIQTTFMNFATFNIADIYITVGAVLLVLYVIIFDKDEKYNGTSDNISA